MLLAAIAACGDASSTEPDPVPPVNIARAAAIGLLTPFDSTAPLVRLAHDSQPSVLSVQLRDASGQSVRQAGRTLTLTVLDPGGAPSTRIQIRRGATALTDTAGIARVTNLVLAGRTGPALISAVVDSLPALRIPLRLEPGVNSNAASAVSVAPDTMAVGGVSQVTVVPMDASGNKRGSGQQVSAMLDGDQTLATVSTFTFVAADSTYRASITVNAPAPSRALRTNVNGGQLTITPMFTGVPAPPPPPVPAAALRLTTLPGDTTPAFQILSGAVWASMTVQLVDAAGAVVRQSGIPVTARAMSVAGSPLANATLTGAGPVSTNLSGQATFPAISLTAPSGVARLRFEAPNLAATSLPVRTLPGAVSATRSTFTASRDTAIIDSIVSLRVTPRDASGSALGSGQVVALSVGGGTSAGAISAVTYEASDSSYRATLTARTAGTTSLIRATVGSTQLSASAPITVIVAPGVVSPASPVSLTPDSIPVAGVAQLVTTPLDGAGRKLGAGQSVSIVLTGAANTATVSAVTYSAADSSYTAGITGVTLGSVTVTTTVNGVTLAATRQLTVSASAPPPPVPATALAITTLPGDTTGGGLDVPSGSLLNGVTIALRSASGASVLQAGVAITVTAVTSAGTPWTGATLSGGGPLSTGADGTITFPALRLSASVGSGRLRFSAANLSPASLPVRVRAGAASTSASTFTLSTESIAVGASSAATIVVRDANNNKIGSGQTVAIALGAGTSGITVGAVSFNAADSSYRATLTGVTAGSTRSVQASVGGAALTTTRSLTVTAAASADITATVNGATTYPISRYIYGGNVVNEASSYGNATMPAEFTFNRLGGNRGTAYNWENNYSNAGHDYFYWNTADGLVGTTAGGTVRRHADPSFARGQAFMATVPMSGYVSADACNCNVGTSDADRANRLATRFRVSRASKGSAFTTTPNASDGFVYQDEFVNWVESTYPGRSTHPTAPVFFSLDNEPDIWHLTHKEIFSDLNDNASTPRLQTYTGFADTSVVYASAIKSVLPNALVFGAATATYTGITLLGRYPSPDPVYGTQNFTDVYLDRMRAAETAAGRRLLDVLDVHFYSEAGTNGGTISNDYATQDAAMIEARVQAPRSLWDPTYNDGSWVTGVTGGPIRLLPRLRDQIAAHYPGTRLAVTEYYYGRGGDISGGIAQADVFGIFGREGVFAASLWPFAGLNASNWNGNGNLAYAYIFGALRMFRNYDGAGNSFGDTGLQATTSNVAQSSIYASRTAGGRTVLLVINKTSTPKVTQITLSGTGAATSAQVYVMRDGTPNPSRQADVAVSGNVLTYTMPAMSVSTLALIP